MASSPTVNVSASTQIQSVVQTALPARMPADVNSATAAAAAGTQNVRTGFC